MTRRVRLGVTADAGLLTVSTAWTLVGLLASAMTKMTAKPAGLDPGPGARRPPSLEYAPGPGRTAVPPAER